MKAVFSDTHGNKKALDIGLDRMEADDRVTEIVCLGDITGMSRDQDACVLALRSRGVKSTRGNHDEVFGDKKADSRIIGITGMQQNAYKYLMEGMAVAEERGTYAACVEVIRGMATHIIDNGFLYMHAPQGRFEVRPGQIADVPKYMYPWELLLDKLKKKKSSSMGHYDDRHAQMLRKLRLAGNTGLTAEDIAVLRDGESVWKELLRDRSPRGFSWVRFDPTDFPFGFKYLPTEQIPQLQSSKYVPAADILSDPEQCVYVGENFRENGFPTYSPADLRGIWTGHVHIQSVVMDDGECVLPDELIRKAEKREYIEYGDRRFAACPGSLGEPRHADRTKHMYFVHDEENKRIYPEVIDQRELDLAA